MHPADQAAFGKVCGFFFFFFFFFPRGDSGVYGGSGLAAIRFSGAVSPKLMMLYRKGDMNLDQLSAFAITEDHERQERVWKVLPPFNRSRHAILHALSEGQVRSDDRRALFVGSKVYEGSGRQHHP